MKALVSVGGYDFPEPSTYDGNTATLVDGGRNTRGVQVGTVIRDDVAKVTLTWRYLTVGQWSKINKCFAEKHGGKFYNNVTFFDQTAGGYVTRKMYISDRTAGMWRRDHETGEVLGWTNCSLSLVEV